MTIEQSIDFKIIRIHVTWVTNLNEFWGFTLNFNKFLNKPSDDSELNGDGNFNPMWLHWDF